MSEVTFTLRRVVFETNTMPLEGTVRETVVAAVRHLARHDDIADVWAIDVDGYVVAWFGPEANVPNGAHPKALIFADRIRQHIAQRLPPNEMGERHLPDGVPEMTEDDFT